MVVRRRSNPPVSSLLAHRFESVLWYELSTIVFCTTRTDFGKMPKRIRRLTAWLVYHITSEIVDAAGEEGKPVSLLMWANKATAWKLYGDVFDLDS
jgi:hypothetical protein